MTKSELIELAKECDFYFHPVHKCLCVKHSNGSWVQVDEQLAAFANAVIERCAVRVNDALGDEMLSADVAVDAIRAMKVEE